MIESSDSPLSIDIARKIFRKAIGKPKSLSNAVTSAVRQINRKLEKINADYRIVGKANGRGGKTLSFQSI